MTDFLEPLVEPWREPFMRRALLAMLLVGVMAGAAGVHVVTRRLAFLGHGLAHAVLPGAVLAWLAGIDLVLGAAGAALTMALGVAWASRGRVVREDGAVGVVHAGFFALGLLLLQRSGAGNLESMLLGSPLTVGPPDLVLLGGFAVVGLGLLAAFHKELELSSYDETYGEVIGLDPHRLRALLLVVVALVVVAALRTVGVLLASALLVTPAAAALLVARSLLGGMLLAAAIAALSGVAGLYLSWHADWPAGASVVLVSTLAFALLRLGQRAP